MKGVDAAFVERRFHVPRRGIINMYRWQMFLKMSFKKHQLEDDGVLPVQILRCMVVTKMITHTLHGRLRVYSKSG